MNFGPAVWLRVLVLVVVLNGAYGSWRDRTVSPPAGVLAPAEPEQTEILAGMPIAHGRWQLTPRARYDITARVLGRERYHVDLLAGLVPVDLALGWGPMSDSSVLSHLKIEQGGRFYWVKWPADPPLEPTAILRHSANTHTIPADRRIERQLERLRVGEIVHLVGQLVDARRDDGATIQTSLTREDSGGGACEVMLVESLERVPAQRP
jgi:hypothetical protein